jgi:hypothetical protein
MGVDSYLELFTTLYGWALYNNIWSVLTGTGLAFIPFIVILIRNFVAVNTSMEVNAGTGASVRRMEIEIALALTVVVLAAQPALNLQASELRYSPPATLANPTPATVNPNTTGTTFGHPDGGFNAAPTSVRVPIWWYGVMSISSGLNHAVVTGLPASNERREMERALRTVNIEDPALQREVNEFYSRCYVPARSKYLEQQPAAAAPILSARGADDPDWIGSHVYRNVGGYYDTLHADNPVPGIPVNLSRDTDQFWNDTSGTIEHGIPYCNEWWEHPSHGLRARLIDDNSRTRQAWTWVTAQFSSVDAEQRRDLLSRRILERTPTTYTPSMSAQRAQGQDPGIIGTAARFFHVGVASVGLVTFYNMVIEPTLTLILHALPFVQALTLMGIYALLPLVLVFGMYQPSILLIGAVGIFTVKFWAVLWHITLWVDSNLFQSMYPDGVSFLQSISAEHGMKQILITMITAAMYVGLPVLWTFMMGWVGYHAMSGANQFSDRLSGTTNQAGSAGGRLAGGGARAAGGAAMSRGGKK